MLVTYLSLKIFIEHFELALNNVTLVTVIKVNVMIPTIHKYL